MRLNVDPIQALRQVQETKGGLRKAANSGETDQERVTGRVGYFVFPEFMGVVAGELYRGTLPPLIAGAVIELIGKMAASTVETIFADEDHEKALFNLLGAAHAIAQTEIQAAKARAAAEAQQQKDA